MEALSFSQIAISAIGGWKSARKPKRSGSIHRTGDPVRRDSIEAGTFEDSFFVAPAKGEIWNTLDAAKELSGSRRGLRARLLSEGKTPSELEGWILKLSANVVSILEKILNLARQYAGRVYPSYEWLTEKTSLSRGTIASALRILEGLGLLDRQRRFTRVEVEGVGPRYKQTSNAYRTSLPDKLLAYLPRRFRPAPVPVDYLQHRAESASETEAMLATLSCREYAKAVVGGQLGKVLAKLGASIDRVESESNFVKQPLIDSFINREAGVGLVGQRAFA
jgi:DNA-binding transcriptional ArsR family regulator